MKNEDWKQVDGFPRYEVSDRGRVRRAGKVLSTPQKGNGYLQATLRHDGMSRNHSVHRLVAAAFLPAMNGKELVLHINGNRADNRVDNLYRGDFSDNAQDAIRHGTFARGSKNGRAKLTEDDVRSIRFELIRGGSQSELAREYGVSRGLIHRIAKGKCWNHVSGVLA